MERRGVLRGGERDPPSCRCTCLGVGGAPGLFPSKRRPRDKAWAHRDEDTKIMGLCAAVNTNAIVPQFVRGVFVVLGLTTNSKARGVLQPQTREKVDGCPDHRVALRNPSISPHPSLKAGPQGKAYGCCSIGAADGRVLGDFRGPQVRQERGACIKVIEHPELGAPPDLLLPGVLEGSSRLERGHCRDAQRLSQINTSTLCLNHPTLCAVWNVAALRAHCMHCHCTHTRTPLSDMQKASLHMLGHGTLSGAWFQLQIPQLRGGSWGRSCELVPPPRALPYGNPAHGPECKPPQLPRVTPV